MGKIKEGLGMEGRRKRERERERERERGGGGGGEERRGCFQSPTQGLKTLAFVLIL